MSELRVAIRYAKSLLDLSIEQNKLEAINEDMILFQEVCAASAELRALLRNPIIPGAKKMNVLRALFQGKVDDLTMRFYEVVVRKYRSPYLMEIAKQFRQQYNLYKNIQETYITTAMAMDDEQRRVFSEIAAEISGKQPELIEEIDQDIIGGFILKVDDKQIDASIKSSLNELKIKLTK